MTVAATRAHLPVMLALVDRFNAAVDAELVHLRRLGAAEDPPERVACREGCAACCTLVVGITEAEAARLAVALDELPRARGLELRGRLEAWERDFRGWSRRQPVVTDGAGLVARDARWAVQRKACPLLDTATHRCTLYAARPTACRAHHACDVPEAVRGTTGPNGEAPPNDPGDGCFVTPADVARGKSASVWQLRNDLVQLVGARLAQALEAAGVTDYGYGALPLLVLAAGREYLGWRPSGHRAARAPVPTLARSFPRGRA